MTFSTVLNTDESKAARYFDVEEKYVYCTADRFVIDPKEAVDLIDENTIGVGCPFHSVKISADSSKIATILGTTYTGEYEDIKAINDLLVERNIDCPIHGTHIYILSSAHSSSR